MELWVYCKMLNKIFGYICFNIIIGGARNGSRRGFKDGRTGRTPALELKKNLLFCIKSWFFTNFNHKIFFNSIYTHPPQPEILYPPLGCLWFLNVWQKNKYGETNQLIYSVIIIRSSPSANTLNVRKLWSPENKSETSTAADDCTGSRSQYSVWWQCTASS